MIKSEYYTELRSNIQLADLVSRIAPNIDSLLKRYDKAVNVNKVEMVETVDMLKVTGGFARGSGFTTGQRGGRSGAFNSVFSVD